MLFKLIKTRINTHYNAASTPFIDSTNLASFLKEVNQNITIIDTVKPYAENSQQYAKACYLIAYNGEVSTLEIILTQSATHTAYCFDIFFKLMPSPVSNPQFFYELVDSLATVLENLRKKYNGKWQINDDQLTLDALR